MTQVTKKPLSRTAIKSYNKLLDAAEAVLYDKGYLNCTVNDIAKEANLATGTFYIYFESKYSMYVHVIKKYGRELKQRLSAAIIQNKCSSRIEKELVGLKTFILHVLEKPRCYKLIWEALYIDKNLFFEYYREFAESYIRGFEADAQQIDSSLDLQTLAYCMMGIANFVGLLALSDQDFTDQKLDVIIATARQMLTRGAFKDSADLATPSADHDTDNTDNTADQPVD